MKRVGFEAEVKLVEKGRCPMCEEPIHKFRDDLSYKEFTISGMCQECQDEVFGGGE